MYPRAGGAPPKAALRAALVRFEIARPGEENAPTVAGASGRVSLRAAGAAKPPFMHKNTDNAFAE